MFKQSKRTLTMLVAAVAVALVWGALSLSAPPPGKGKPPKGDTTPPDPVDTLVVLSTTSSTIELGWVATADDTGDPTAAYDVRYSTDNPDDAPYSGDYDAWFDDANLVPYPPDPALPDQAEIVTVGDLSELTPYWLAVKVADEAGNWSDLSNVEFDITDLTPPGGWRLEVVTSVEVDLTFGPGLRHTELALAYDAQGNPSIAFRYNTPGTAPVQFAYWDETSSSWQDEFIEDDHGTGVSLVYDAGQPTVSYAGGVHNSDEITFARRSGPNDWSSEIVDSMRFGHPNDTSLAYDPLTMNPSIAYRFLRRREDTDVIFAFRDGSSWETEVVDQIEHDVKVRSLAYASGGLPTIAYLADTDGTSGIDTLKFARRDPQTAAWVIEDVYVAASAEALGGDASLAHDGGNPSIAFRVRVDFSYPILMFARFNGSSWDIEEIDAGDYCGDGLSLVYHNGTAYISYTCIDDGRGHVKLAQRNGPNQWTTEIVTSGVRARHHTSLKFDPLGNPSVAYPDTVNDIIKLARIAP